MSSSDKLNLPQAAANQSSRPRRPPACQAVPVGLVLDPPIQQLERERQGAEQRLHDARSRAAH